VVRNRRQDGWGAERAWRLTVVSRIGGTEATGPDAFGRVVDVGIDPLGRIWVADGMQQQLKVFEPDGTFVRSVGRKGGGPAEFMGISGFDWAPDGTLWVLDGGSSRFAVYDTAGRLVATHPRFSGASVTPWPGGFDREGKLLDIGGMRRVGEETVVSLVDFDRHARPVDTLHLPPLREEYFGKITSGDARSQRTRQAPVPFSATQIWGMDPEGYVWYARTDHYRLERRSFDGTVERVVELQNRARPVSGADKEEILRNYRWFQEAGGTLDPSRIPDRHPHLANLFFSPEGELWVLPTYFVGEKPLMDVFDLHGRYLGQVQSPVPFLSHPSPSIRAGRVAAVSRDDDGVDAVVLMRLEKPRR